jgi:hypothetical protein
MAQATDLPITPFPQSLERRSARLRASRNVSECSAPSSIPRAAWTNSGHARCRGQGEPYRANSSLGWSIRQLGKINSRRRTCSSAGDGWWASDPYGCRRAPPSCSRATAPPFASKPESFGSGRTFIDMTACPHWTRRRANVACNGLADARASHHRVSFCSEQRGSVLSSFDRTKPLGYDTEI